MKIKTEELIKKIIEQCMKTQQSYMEFLLDDLVFNRGISIDRITLGKEEGNPLVWKIFIDDNEFIKIDFEKLMRKKPQWGHYEVNWSTKSLDLSRGFKHE